MPPVGSLQGEVLSEMTSMSVSFRSVADTQAAIGRAGSHTVIVDRPAGRAGGEGLGFNGGQLLALAIGGCLCNDIFYVAHELGIAVKSVEVDVEVDFDGAPLLATAARVNVSVTPSNLDADVGPLIERAVAMSTVSNSLTRGFPVTVSR
jgi:uncharacterized OsmC-like protein